MLVQLSCEPSQASADAAFSILCREFNWWTHLTLASGQWPIGCLATCWKFVEYPPEWQQAAGILYIHKQFERNYLGGQMKMNFIYRSTCRSCSTFLTGCHLRNANAPSGQIIRLYGVYIQVSECPEVWHLSELCQQDRSDHLCLWPGVFANFATTNIQQIGPGQQRSFLAPARENIQFHVT